MNKTAILVTLFITSFVCDSRDNTEVTPTSVKFGGGLVTISFPPPAQIEQNIRNSCQFDSQAISVPVVCQQLGSLVFNQGKDKITKLGLKDILTSGFDPFGLMSDRESLQKRIAVGTGLMIVGATIVGTCPPIPVETGWGDLSFSQRLQRAQAFGYVPPGLISITEDVDNPLAPNSCTKTLDINIDENNQSVGDFGVFDEREFAYITPFGSYPSATTQLGAASPALASCLASVVDLIDVSTGASVNVSNVDLDFGPDVSLDGVMDGLADKIIDAIGLSAFESTALQQFNGWKSYYRQNNPSYCDDVQCEFEHGVNKVKFDADINPASWGNLSPATTYFQEVDVMEYFDPELTAFPLTVNLEALEIGGTRVSKYPPRAFTGTPPNDKNYTFDKSWLGVIDNCDQQPKIEMDVPDFLPLGIHDFPVKVTDRVGNVTEDTVRIIVDDTIPPDLLANRPVGILVPDGTATVNFNDPGIGCDTFLCEGTPPDVSIYPPTYFDFGSITPTVSCEMQNSLNTTDCAASMLPVNGMSSVSWDIADPSGNISMATQDVYVREQSMNQAPTAPDQTYIIGSNSTVEIPLNAVDDDFDPLMFTVTDQPGNGNVDGDPQAVFQTRFNTTGLLASSDGVVYVRNINEGVYGLLVASAEEQKLYMFTEGGGELVNRFDLDLAIVGGITPDAITFDDGKNFEDQSDQLSSVLRNNGLWVGDWSNRKVYRYKYNNNQHMVEEMFDLPNGLELPTGISAFRNGSTVTVVIADQQDQQLWKFEVNANSNPPSLLNTNNFDNIGLVPDHVDFSSNTDHVYISSKSEKKINKYSLSQGILGSWPITSLIDDPDGDDPALPVLQNAVDFLVFSDGGSTTELNWFDATEFKWVKTEFQNFNSEPTIEDTFRLPSFVEILAMEEFNDNGITKFVVLALTEQSNQYLIRYDLQGRIDSLVSLYDGSSPNPLPPAVSNPGYIDIALKDNGDVLLLAKGNGNNVPSITAIHLNSGVDNYSSVSGNIAFNLSFPIAIDVTGNTGVILGEDSVNSYSFGSSDTQELVNFEGFNSSPYADIAVSDSGVIYLSHTNNNQIDSYAMFGAFQMSLGVGELDFDSNDQYGKLFYDNVLNKLWVSDFAEIFYPNLGVGGETHRMPRLLSYGDTGTLLDTLIPEGTPGDFFSFLEPGDFGTITAIAAGDDDRFYVAETQPLNRLHVFDSQIFVEVACQNGAEGQVCNLLGYTPDNGYAGTEIISIMASDPFGAASNEATVTLDVINDIEAPVISCPSPIEVQANSTNGYTANLVEPDKEVNQAMREFLQGASYTENTDLPPVIITHDIPAEIPLGNQLVTFIAVDGSSNQGQCLSSINVVDTLKPVFPELVDLSFEAIGPLSNMATLGVVTPTVTDNSSINNVVVLGSMDLPVGENKVIWQATDIAGNQSQSTQTIIIEDTTAPSFSVLTDKDQFSNDTMAAITYIVPTVSDLVSTNVEVSCQPAIGAMVSQGVQPVNCTATDESNNQSNDTFIIDVFGDSDHFSTGTDQFSDAVNGGFTDLSLINTPLSEYLVYDGPTTDRGLVFAMAQEVSARGGTDLASLSACMGQYTIAELNFEDLIFDDISERFGDHVIVSCDGQGNAKKISALIGNFTVQQVVNFDTTDTTIEIDLTTSNEISIEGRTLSANSNNLSPTEIRLYGESYFLSPGYSLIVYGPNDLIFRNSFE